MSLLSTVQGEREGESEAANPATDDVRRRAVGTSNPGSDGSFRRASEAANSTTD